MSSSTGQTDDKLAGLPFDGEALAVGTAETLAQ